MKFKLNIFHVISNILLYFHLYLQRQRVILIITILFGAIRDEESAVKAAGLRALGMLVTLPSLEHDTGFLMDLADTVCSAFEDKNLGVRVKSAWALANLCDCLSRQKFVFFRLPSFIIFFARDMSSLFI